MYRYIIGLPNTDQCYWLQYLAFRVKEAFERPLEVMPEDTKKLLQSDQWKKVPRYKTAT